jgi:hypothetical protein
MKLDISRLSIGGPECLPMEQAHFALDGELCHVPGSMGWVPSTVISSMASREIPKLKLNRHLNGKI